MRPACDAAACRGSAAGAPRRRPRGGWLAPAPPRPQGGQRRAADDHRMGWIDMMLPWYLVGVIVFLALLALMLRLCAADVYDKVIVVRATITTHGSPAAAALHVPCGRCCMLLARVSATLLRCSTGYLW
jgi:hypothetical protein